MSGKGHSRKILRPSLMASRPSWPAALLAAALLPCCPAGGAADGDLRVFSCGDTFTTVAWCKGHTKAARAVAFSPDGYSLVSASGG